MVESGSDTPTNTATDTPTNTPTNTGKAPKKRLWLRALFALSLALNVLVIGAIAGAAWRHGGPDSPRARPGGPGSGISMLREMEPQDRRAVLRAARQARGQEPDRAAHQAALVAVLKAETLDVAAFDALIAQQQAAASARVAALTEAWRGQVLAMTPDARAAYAARLAEARHWGSGRGKEKGDR